MRMLIRIVFVIFIANVIDCLGSVWDNCCDWGDCFKDKDENKEIKEENKEEEKKDEEIKEYEEIEDEGNITAKFLVNDAWYKVKEENLVLKIFKKKDDNAFPSKDNGDKISIESDEKGNPKIVYQNLEGEKYAFFEIKTNTDKTVYLYCSDVESSEKDYGIFEHMDHISISVIACDTEKVTDMGSMFCNCSSLTNLDLQNFNTKNVMDMAFMFSNCSSLKELNLKNFNTTKVTDMAFMFSNCSSLKELNLNNFDTTNVTNMNSMFCNCSSLKNLDLNNFDTTNVTNMNSMFCNCSSLKNLKIGDNFNTKNNPKVENMFYNCEIYPMTLQINFQI